MGNKQTASISSLFRPSVSSKTKLLENPHEFVQVLQCDHVQKRVSFPFAGQYKRMPKKEDAGSGGRMMITPEKETTLTLTFKTLRDHFKVNEKYSEVDLYTSTIRKQVEKEGPIRHIEYQYEKGVDKSTYLEYSCVRSQSNALFEAVKHAYNTHIGLILTPDMIWSSITQGIGRHVNHYAEHYRTAFVTHDGKKELSVCLNTLNWDLFIQKLCDLVMQDLTEDDKSESKGDWDLRSDFTTSDRYSKLASAGVMLYTFKEYYSYGMVLACGFSELILKGTIEDWKRLKEKSVKLISFLRTHNQKTSYKVKDEYHYGPDKELELWQSGLLPVLDMFIETRSNPVWTKEQDEFWGRTLTTTYYGSGDSTTYLNGWLSQLFPYNNQGHFNWSQDRIDIDGIPDGYVTFPSKLYLDGADPIPIEIQVLSGMLGYRVTKDGYAETQFGIMIKDKIKQEDKANENNIKDLEKVISKAISESVKKVEEEIKKKKNEFRRRTPNPGPLPSPKTIREATSKFFNQMRTNMKDQPEGEFDVNFL